MDKVSTPSFLHIPGTSTLVVVAQDFWNNVQTTRSTDLGKTWANASKPWPHTCDWTVQGSIHCGFGANMLTYDQTSGTIILLINNFTRDVPITPKHCDDPEVFDGGTFQLNSTDLGISKYR